MLLEDLLQFGLHVVVHVGLERVLEQDSDGSQEVMQPVWHAEHHPPCEVIMQGRLEKDAFIHRTENGCSSKTMTKPHNLATSLESVFRTALIPYAHLLFYYNGFALYLEMLGIFNNYFKGF